MSYRKFTEEELTENKRKFSGAMYDPTRRAALEKEGYRLLHIPPMFIECWVLGASSIPVILGNGVIGEIKCSEPLGKDQ